MRKFTTLCKDIITGNEMILSECSFNEACWFLESENADGRFGTYKGTECASLHVHKLVFEKALFLYDEERGYLMRKEQRK